MVSKIIDLNNKYRATISKCLISNGNSTSHRAITSACVSLNSNDKNKREAFGKSNTEVSRTKKSRRRLLARGKFLWELWERFMLRLGLFICSLECVELASVDVLEIFFLGPRPKEYAN